MSAHGSQPLRTYIVVPCYNEAERLNLDAFGSYLAGSESVGIIFVNDGSTDETDQLLATLSLRFPKQTEIIDQHPNRGKAEAVRVGVLRAFEKSCAYVGYFDADLATPLSEVDVFSRTLDTHKIFDMVIGSRLRLLGREILRNPLRHYLGRIFATTASLVLNLPVYDTQCGAKLFRATPAVRDLFVEPFGVKWTFDVEIFARFLQSGGSRTAMWEQPVHRWADVQGSKVKPIDFLRAIGEMALVYRRYRFPRDLDPWLRIGTMPLVRYVGAGGFGTLAHYLTLMLAVELFAITPSVATIAGAATGAAINYALNYHLTFGSKAPHARTLPKFLTVALLIALLNFYGMRFVTARLEVHYLLVQVGCTLAGLLLGFALNKLWTFAESSD